MNHVHIINHKLTLAAPIVILHLLFASSVIFGPSILVYAEEEQLSVCSQVLKNPEENMNGDIVLSEDEGSARIITQEDNQENNSLINQPITNEVTNTSDVEIKEQAVSDSSIGETAVSLDRAEQSPAANDVNTASDGVLTLDTDSTTDRKDVLATASQIEEEDSKDSKGSQKDTLVIYSGSENTGEKEIVNIQESQFKNNGLATSTSTDSTEVSDNSHKDSIGKLEANDTTNTTHPNSKDPSSNESNAKYSDEEDSDEKNIGDIIAEKDNLTAENASDTEETEMAFAPNQPLVPDGEKNLKSISNYVTPQDFGAKGDNESDDTDAINQAIGSLSTEHDTLYIPDGSYRVNTIQKINLRSDIKVILGSNAKLIAIPNGEKSYCILSLRGLNNVSISGGQLYGDRYEHQGSEGEWGHGIGIFDSTDIVLDGIKIFNCWGDGIYLGSDHEWTQDAGCSNIIIRNCELAGNRRNDLSIVSADYVTLKNCIFRDANGTDPQFGVDIETNYESNPNQHIYIDNCTFYGNAKGSVLINSAANDVQISNSVLNGNFINYAGTDVVLSNTTVNGDAYCRKGITLKDNSIINGRGNTNDVAVVDYSAANAAPLHSYRQDSSNRISSWFASDTYSPSGSCIGIVRTGWGTHDAGITLRLAELSGGRFGKMIPGRTYRIQYTVMGTGAWGYISNQTGWYPILPQGEAYSTGIVTYLAGDTADGTLSFYATGLNDGMWLRIANIQVLDEDYSGMSQQCDGTWVYSENGNVDTKYTGMAANDSGWWYFNDGEIDWDYTGMAQNENGWWYYRNGRIDWSYTGEGTCQYGTWYYQNGRIPYGLTGMVLTDKEWRYVQNGRIVTDYTGMASNPVGWWYFRNGEIDWNYTGMAQNGNGWWYYRNGRIDWNYTGEASNEYGTWYYQNGRIASSLTGMVLTDKEWRYVQNGRVVTDYTGMSSNPVGWWYYRNGTIDWKYCGPFVDKTGNEWQIINGHAIT